MGIVSDVEVAKQKVAEMESAFESAKAGLVKAEAAIAAVQPHMTMISEMEAEVASGAHDVASFAAKYIAKAKELLGL